MAIYRYHNSPLIDRIEVHTLYSGVSQAVIYAKDNADAAQLQAVRVQLGQHNLSSLMDSKDNHASLQIRGFKDPDKLIQTLAKIPAIGPSSSKEQTTEDKIEKKSFIDKIHDQSLFLSALFYDLGNISLIVSGIQRGRHNGTGFSKKDFSEIGTGLAFSVGDVLMTFWGKDKGDEELKVVDRDLKKFLSRKGVEIPSGSELTPESLHQSGALRQIDQWLNKNIVNVKCLSELTGGLLMIHAASKPIEGKTNRGKKAAGMMIASSWLATLLLDKRPAERILDGDKNNAILGQAIINDPRAWIARPFAMANNVANLYGVFNKKDGEKHLYKRGIEDAKEQVRLHNTPENRATLALKQSRQHDYMWMVITACSFLVAHTLFGLSGQKRPKSTDDDKRMTEDLVLLSANVIAKQPDAVRDTVIAETAQYVSKLSHVNLPQAKIEEAIRGKVSELSHSSWASRIQASQGSQQLSV